jgi:hypothetical protein
MFHTGRNRTVSYSTMRSLPRRLHSRQFKYCVLNISVSKTMQKCHKVLKSVFSFRSSSLFYLFVHSGCRGFLFSLDHTQTHTTVGRTPLDDGSARRRDLYLTKQILCKRQISTPPVRFEPKIPASARPQTYKERSAETNV